MAATALSATHGEEALSLEWTSGETIMWPDEALLSSCVMRLPGLSTLQSRVGNVVILDCRYSFVLGGCLDRKMPRTGFLPLPDLRQKQPPTKALRVSRGALFT